MQRNNQCHRRIHWVLHVPTDLHLLDRRFITERRLMNAAKKVWETIRSRVKRVTNANILRRLELRYFWLQQLLKCKMLSVADYSNRRALIQPARSMRSTAITLLHRKESLCVNLHPGRLMIKRFGQCQPIRVALLRRFPVLRHRHVITATLRSWFNLSAVERDRITETAVISGRSFISRRTKPVELFQTATVEACHRLLLKFFN